MPDRTSTVQHTLIVPGAERSVPLVGSFRCYPRMPASFTKTMLFTSELPPELLVTSK